MSGELIPARGFADASQRRHDRAISRQVGSLERYKAVGLARMEVQAELEAAKVHAVGYVGQQAMQAVTIVSQLEHQLGSACPMAVTRLQGIADMTALSVAQVVADSARKIGR